MIKKLISHPADCSNFHLASRLAHEQRSQKELFHLFPESTATPLPALGANGCSTNRF
jgi:hypothetical protein